MRPPIPDDVRRFILTSVPSVPYLEAMLLLRAEPAAVWDASALSRRLYISQQKADEVLRQLGDAGFVASEAGMARWQPRAELAALVEQLAHLYAEDLVGVTQLIHAWQERRAMQFADAFRLRKKED